MKKIFLLLTLAFSLGSVIAQSANTINDPDARARSLNAPFHAISVSDGIELYLSAGQSEQLAVSMSDPSYDDKFKTEVVNGELKIYYKREGVKLSRPRKLNLKAYVSFKTLDKLEASAGSEVNFQESLQVNSLDIKLTSGALLEGKVEAADLRIVQNSGAKINMTGQVANLNLDLSSGAKFQGYDLSTRSCNAEASSGARIEVNIDRELAAKASSGGSIHYKGQGVIKDIKVNSGGVVKKV